MRSVPGNSAACWCAAAAAVLALAAAWAAPGKDPVADMSRAYDLGQVTEARALAGKYLASSQAALRNAKSEEQRIEAVSLVQYAAWVLSKCEMILPRAGRFRNSTGLIAEAERALAAAERVPVPEERLPWGRSEFGTIYGCLLAAANGIQPRARLAEILRAHPELMTESGVDSPEAYFALPDEVEPEARLKPGNLERVAAVAGRFVRGYAARDPAAIAATTWLSVAEAQQRFQDGGLAFFAGTAARVSKIAIRPVTAEWVTADQPDFLVYLPDVQLQLVAPGGAAYSKTVDRTLSVHGDIAGASRLWIRVDETQTVYAAGSQ